MLRLTVMAIALLLPLATMGAAGAADSLTIERVWARATPGTARTGVIYLRIESPIDDTLIAADTPVAQETELHDHLDDNGVMKMRKLEDGLAVPAGQTLEMKPGGVHQVMLMGMRRQLKAGERFPLTLYFERAGTRDVIVKVERVGAMGPSDDADGAQNAMDQNVMDQNAMGDGSTDHGAMHRGAAGHGSMRHDGNHPAETPGP